MKRKTPLPRRPMRTRQPAKGPSGMRPLKPIRKKPRSKAETERVYGTKKRQDWYRAQMCLTCLRRPVELAHTKNGGTGRKADADTIIPLCMTCHHALHSMGVQTFERAYGGNLFGWTLARWAESYDAAWRAFSGGAATAQDGAA